MRAATPRLCVLKAGPCIQNISQVAHVAAAVTLAPLPVQAGRVRPTLDYSSVCVRLVCGSRQGQLEAPAWSIPLAEQRLTR